MNDTDLPSLRAFLAERDVPCPACGYNLRGAQDPVCPECGGPVELSIEGRAGARGYVLLLLVVFGWLALVSGMNAARESRAALSEAQVAQTLNLSLSGFGAARVSLGGSISAQTIIINGNSVRPGRPVSINGLTAVPTATGRTRNWAQVSWQTWLALGWSAALAVGAAAGLLLVFLRWGRLLERGPGRALLGTALALAALHIGVQALLFIRELLV